METTGDVTGYIDVAQIMIYLFWAFFAGLLLYIRREDKREGYPLVSERSDSIRVQGFPSMPPAKVFRFEDGSEYRAPGDSRDDRELIAEPTAPWLGAPIEPIGDPLAAGVGPGSYAIRPETPETTAEGDPRLRPMRILDDFRVAEGSPDPRGMVLVGADETVVGRIVDLWIDLSESQLRYLEFELASSSVAISDDAVSATRLVPIAICRVDASARVVRTGALLAEQFQGIPAVRASDRVTMMEEERITAYCGSGYLYATEDRQEALV
ncbi:MAG: photosynthetic reaction center subunit H [Myxococcota bacterium]